MASINKVFISGNVTRDPELRSTAAGMPVLGFGVAVNDRMKNSKTGEWEDRPNFLDCTMFGARAESLSRFLSKGQKVAVEGKLRWSQWERDGQKRCKVEIIVDEVVLMSRSNDSQGTAPAVQANYYAAPQPTPQNASQPSYGANYGYGYGSNYSASDAVQANYEQQSFDATASVYDEDIPF